jgi:hypothetical protein
MRMRMRMQKYCGIVLRMRAKGNAVPTITVSYDSGGAHDEGANTRPASITGTEALNE